MAMEDLMKALMQGASAAAQQPGTADALSQVLGGLMGGGQQSGGAAGGQMLGALEQIIGGQPGSGQALNMNQGTAMNMGGMNMNDPIMLLLQPVVNQLAAKANISPQIAMVVASIAIHYLLSSHPSTPGTGKLDLGSVMQEIGSGKMSASTLHDSGMVNDVMQATGMSKTEAVKSLNATFGALGAHAKGSVGGGRSTK